MTVSRESLSERIADAMLCDQHSLRRRLRALAQLRGAEHAAALAALERDLQRSCERRAQRLLLTPRCEFPPELPISQCRDEIAAAIAAHPVVVVCGETGSGKTTQLPKICLELGRGIGGFIGHTQPRRLAARTVAARIAQELNSPLGVAVGYKVRFSDHTHSDGYVKLMTDGILLAEIQQDRYLTRYDTLIIDEAHERSLNIDFLLGYLKRLLPKRPDLKLIVTSATIDPQRFSCHFGDAPVIEVSGRTYPVEMRYRPLLAQDEDGRDRDQRQAILDAVDELARIGPGDVLIFLSGEREIRDTAEALRKHHPPHTEIVPLYARLSAQEQNRVFQSHGGRRIVLATNVAETSITVPGIRYVVDTGYARMSRYSHRSKVQRLPIEKISQAAANQRAGRCGRVSAGVCIRLYDEADYLMRPRFTEPEILRSNLAAVILQMLALGLGEIEDFPFVEPPDGRYVRDGYQTLLELGAVDEARQLTPLGKKLARLPIDPRVARMVLAASGEGALAEVLIIAAALAVPDPRERPLEQAQAADQKHKLFQDERSDFLGYLQLWGIYHEHARHLSQAKLRQWCREHFLSYVRLRDWHDIHAQIAAMVKDMGLHPNAQPAVPDAIHRALLAGLLSNIGWKTEAQEYLGARGVKFTISPGSALHKKGLAWLMAAELTETGRIYARTVAPIDPLWIERLAPHLIKRHYLEPHWERKQASVMALERVTLFGLTLVPGRKVHYGRIDPKTSRKLFIRDGLVEGEYHTEAPFFHHNRELIAEVEGIEHKVRRQDILVDPETLYAFYDERIPAGIYDGRSFERWRLAAEQADPQQLFLSREYLMRREPQLAVEQFPERLKAGALELPLSYRFEPGHAEDGVTATLPLAALNQLPEEPLEWLVPGMLQDKIAALIKSLPKNLRRNFVPAPDFAKACVQALTPYEGNLRQRVAHQLLRMTGLEVPEDAWDISAIPPHLLMNLKLLGADGNVAAMGRDVAALRAAQGEQAARSFARMPTQECERDQVIEWDFGDLPSQVEFTREGVRLAGYPALVDERGKVALRLLDSPVTAERAHRAGVRRLYMLIFAEKMKYLQRNLPGIQAMCMHYMRVGGCEDLKQDIVAAVCHHAFECDAPARTAAQFAARGAQGAGRLVMTAQELCGWVGEALAQYHAVAGKLARDPAPGLRDAYADMRQQVERLIRPGFVLSTPYAQLRHLARYLKAVAARIDKLPANTARDKQLMAEIQPLWKAYEEHAAKHARAGVQDPHLQTYRWLIEELRVSLFAQELRTVVPVSVLRLKKQWEKIRAV